jgi:hypothetical protein
MMSFFESRAQTREIAFLTLLIPVINPRRGANGQGILTQRFARRGTASRLLLAQDPFIVSIPTMQGLIATGKAFIPRSGTDTPHHIQTSCFFLVEFRQFRRKDLRLLFLKFVRYSIQRAAIQQHYSFFNRSVILKHIVIVAYLAHFGHIHRHDEFCMDMKIKICEKR